MSHGSNLTTWQRDNLTSWQTDTFEHRHENKSCSACPEQSKWMRECKFASFPGSQLLFNVQTIFLDQFLYQYVYVGWLAMSSCFFTSPGPQIVRGHCMYVTGWKSIPRPGHRLIFNIDRFTYQPSIEGQKVAESQWVHGCSPLTSSPPTQWQ